MYSVVLMMALTTGGTTMDRGHHGGCCGEVASCGCEGGRHHGGRHQGGCCGEVASCGSCGYSAGCGSCGQSAGCATCGHAYGPSVGCSTCANGVCSLTDGVRVVENEAPATIIVSLPADAKLTIDDEATAATSDQRVFVSPNLPTGKEYHYTLKAEIKVDGKSVMVTERVTVKAGEESRITLAAPTGVAAR